MTLSAPTTAADTAASVSVAHLQHVWQAPPLAEFDPEAYHDFQVNRPVVSIEDGRRRLTWPTTRVYIATPPGAERDVVLVRGIEPSMRWRAFVAELLGIAEELGSRDESSDEPPCGGHIGTVAPRPIAGKRVESRAKMPKDQARRIAPPG